MVMTSCSREACVRYAGVSGWLHGALRQCRNSVSTRWRVAVSSQTGRAGDYASSLALEDAHQRIRFTREEMPRLLGMFGFIAALHVIGWGLFTH